MSFRHRSLSAVIALILTSSSAQASGVAAQGTPAHGGGPGEPTPTPTPTAEASPQCSLCPLGEESVPYVNLSPESCGVQNSHELTGRWEPETRIELCTSRTPGLIQYPILAKLPDGFHPADGSETSFTLRLVQTGNIRTDNDFCVQYLPSTGEVFLRRIIPTEYLYSWHYAGEKIHRGFNDDGNSVTLSGLRMSTGDSAMEFSPIELRVTDVQRGCSNPLGDWLEASTYYKSPFDLPAGSKGHAASITYPISAYREKVMPRIPAETTGTVQLQSLQFSILQNTYRATADLRYTVRYQRLAVGLPLSSGLEVETLCGGSLDINGTIHRSVTGMIDGEGGTELPAKLVLAVGGQMAAGRSYSINLPLNGVNGVRRGLKTEELLAIADFAGSLSVTNAQTGESFFGEIPIPYMNAAVPGAQTSFSVMWLENTLYHTYTAKPCPSTPCPVVAQVQRTSP